MTVTYFLISLAAIGALFLIYALWLRGWLKKRTWSAGFFEWIEPIEITLYNKSETILFARLLSALGVLLTFLTQASTIDLTPIMPFVPEKYATYVHVAFNSLPLTITILGSIVEWLRNRTTKPIELVAVPEAVITPAVAQALVVAEIAKDDAVAAVQEAKAA